MQSDLDLNIVYWDFRGCLYCPLSFSIQDNFTHTKFARTKSMMEHTVFYVVNSMNLIQRKVYVLKFKLVPWYYVHYVLTQCSVPHRPNSWHTPICDTPISCGQRRASSLHTCKCRQYPSERGDRMVWRHHGHSGLV